MTSAYDELNDIAASIQTILTAVAADEIQAPISRLRDAATQVGKAWSGSWLGYHANVYYSDFQPPPAYAVFSPDYGLFDSMASDTVGDWEQCRPDDVTQAIRARANNPDVSKSEQANATVVAAVGKERSEILSILSHGAMSKPDPYLEALKSDIGSVGTVTVTDLVRRRVPAGSVMTSDHLAMSQGIKIPPHILTLCESNVLPANTAALERLMQFALRAASHLKRKAGVNPGKQVNGTNIFIGHGRSHAWRDLKDFIKDRLKLPHDEFNRVPVAGVPTATRLSEMLENAAFAFLVLTAEDEQADQKLHPRLNVVHEVGLFQGRLGFTKAIVLLEEGCQEFSNIEGLGQIRFPQGCISAVFEEIRLVLEREGLIEEGGA